MICWYHWQSEHKYGNAWWCSGTFQLCCADVFNNTCHGWWGLTAWSPHLPDLNSLDFYLWGHLKTPVYAAPADMKRRFTTALWMPVRLPALNLVEDILNMYYKCTLSAITHEWNVFGYMLIRTYFLVLICGTCSQSLSAPFSYTLQFSLY
jgi:hypothetical protein